MGFFSGLDRNHVYGVAIMLLIVAIVIGTPFLIYYLCPLWFIGAVVFASIVHWFDYLPYQHHWNPSVRELYPYRQSWPERKVMELLHKACVFHSRRWRKKVQLPPELWEQIILCAIDRPDEFGTRCVPKNFHLFVKGHSYHYSHPWNFRTQRQWSKGARRVSRLWEETLRRYSTMWIITGGWPRPNQTHLSRSIRRVDFSVVDPDSYLYPLVPVTEQDQANLSIPLSKLSVVSVRTMAISPSQLYASLCDGVFSHAGKFRAAESFILDAHLGDFSGEVLSGIGASFSHITSLTLIADQIIGILSLEHLETLILSVRQADTQAWNLPRLTHLALSTEEEHRLFYDKNLFPGACQRLKSLQLDPVQILDANEMFWLDHPVLEYLGITSSGFQLTYPPPPEYPLSHIYFWDSKSPVTNMDLGHVARILTGIPRLKTAILPRNNILDKVQAYPAAWRALGWLERRKGVLWLDPLGQDINFLEPFLERRTHQWEEWWVRSWGPYFIYNLVRICTSKDLHGRHINTVMPILMFLWVSFVVWDAHR